MPDHNHPESARPPKAGETRDAARRDREYGHSSGDRNVRHGEDDPPSHRGGTQREAAPGDEDDLTGRE